MTGDVIGAWPENQRYLGLCNWLLQLDFSKDSGVDQPCEPPDNKVKESGEPRGRYGTLSDRRHITRLESGHISTLPSNAVKSKSFSFDSICVRPIGARVVLLSTCLPLHYDKPLELRLRYASPDADSRLAEEAPLFEGTRREEKKIR